MQSYATLRELQVFTSRDTSSLARSLHDAFRIRKDTEEVYKHVVTLITDIQKGKMPGHPIASMHILSCLKEMEIFNIANEFWAWLVDQSEEHTDSRVYGAAIELFSYQGTPLDKLKAMYQEALSRYNAIVNPTSAKTAPVDIVLLQGIITAHLLNKDWKGAYEMFDTALRLYPDKTTSRIFELFIYGRPLQEATLVFLVACRSGCPPRPNVLSPLLKDVFTQSGDVRLMLRLVYTYVAAGGRAQPEFLAPLFKGILSLYPGLIDPHLPETHPQILSKLWECCKILQNAFVESGVKITASPFNSVITEGGKMKLPELVLTALKGLTEANIRPVLETFRALILAFGNLNQGKQSVEAFDGYIESRRKAIQSGETSGRFFKPWTFEEFNSLLWALTVCKQENHALNRLKMMRKELGEELYQKLEQHVKRLVESHRSREATSKSQDKASNYPGVASYGLNREAGSNNVSGSLPDADKTENADGSTSSKALLSIEELEKEIGYLREIFQDESIQNFAESPALQFIDTEFCPAPKMPETGSESLAEKYYEELEKAASNVFEEARESTTFISLKRLKFLNWKAVNRLLYEAEVYEKAKTYVMGDALAFEPNRLKGVKPEDRPKYLEALKRRMVENRAVTRAQNEVIKAFAREERAKKLAHLQSNTLDSSVNEFKTRKGEKNAWESAAQIRSTLAALGMTER